MSRLRLVPYGPAATQALAEATAEAQRKDRLAPVTVVAPSPVAGLFLRRELAAGAQRDADGLVNVRFLSLGRLAELLGAATLAARGRAPETPALRAEAVRAALLARPGPLAAVCDHPSTLRLVDRAVAELRALPSAERDALSRRGGEQVRHLGALTADVQQRLAGCYDAHELARSAAEAVDAGSAALRDIGAVILFLPRQLAPAELALAGALARREALSAIVGVTGDPAADAGALALAAMLPLASAAADRDSSLEAVVGDEIHTVGDADEEAREAVRAVLERMGAGVPLQRIGLLTPPGRDYQALLHEQLSAAGIPFSGPATRTLAQSAAGATVLGALALAQSGFDRDAVAQWLTAAPILERPGGRVAPSARWDLLSRTAGIVRGVDQWRQRLAEQVDERLRERARLEAEGALSDGRAARLDADIDHARRLARFVGALAGDLRPGARSTWAEFARWAHELLRRYLGDEAQRAGWPAPESEAARAVEQRLEALRGLDRVGAGADLAAFRRAVEGELAAGAGRIGRFGRGVFVGRISDAVGLEFDTVVILGMAEGFIPSRALEDPLLSEQARAGGLLRTRFQRLADERRDYLAALAAARRRVLLFSRADERGQRQRLPSRWLLETASAHAGRPVYTDDLAASGRTSWHLPSLSYEWCLREHEPPTARDWTLRALLRSRAAGVAVAAQPIAAGVPRLLAGLAAHDQRRRGGLSAHNGLVGPAPGLALGPDAPVSPTALQEYASCPLRYFLARVLRVAETEGPAEDDAISALERGSLVHEILARFLEEVAADRVPTVPGQPWSEEDRQRLRAIAAEELDQREARGVTGRALLWRLERDQILNDLDEFLDRDTHLRARLGVVPQAAELGFGAETPVVFQPAEAPPLALHGRIDRLDRAPDGSRLAVIDYKTGRHGAYGKALEEDPMGRGQLLQLPVYALAARARYGDVPVSARYWFVTSAGEFRDHGYDVDAEILARFAEAAGTIADGIRAGRFPARPGASATSSQPNCTYCPYDLICPSDRERIWARTRDDPALARYVAMAEPELQEDAP